MDPDEPVSPSSPASAQPPSATHAPGVEPDPEIGGVDMATLGLAVFFVAVIAVVAALLLVQNLS